MGLRVAADAYFGTPTYTKANGSGVLYQVPSFGLSVAAFVALSLPTK